MLLPCSRTFFLPIKKPERYSSLPSIISGLLPGLVLRILLAIMPMILMSMLLKARIRWSLARLDQQVMLMFFIFQVRLKDDRTND